ncbi:adenylate kinase isoenzyme 1 isoform X2 [Episyrphus balteatus]|uniref:adenylate kinase isoenzyme 1 isoform X2 n=1 Tax=Episyrphus balteatus TaxID=286459 RepID=UPI00248521D3|nr:adenylate kinase isoenzyme 1 isoform X2 [Episyrphus balteatus]
MLFMCHQMAMKKEADDKQKALEIRRAQIGVGVPVIWILGGPGCGKGTQCEKIVAKYDFTHLSSGDLLREEVKSGSEKGQELAKVMKEGKLVSNSDVLLLLSNAIKKSLPTAKGFLIDGYPREKDQGAAFEKEIAPADLIIFFDCADQTLVARIMKRAAASAEVRADDNEETLKTRIATFRTNTNAILSQYTDKTLILNAERTVDEIFADVTRAIDAVVQKKAAAVA